MAHLTAILQAHDVLEAGSKDKSIARIGLLKAGHQKQLFPRERLCMLYLIAAAREISQNQATFIS